MNNTPSTQVTDEMVEKFLKSKYFSFMMGIKPAIEAWESFKSSYASSVESGKLGNLGEERWYLRVGSPSPSEEVGHIGYYSEDLAGRSTSGTYRWFFTKDAAVKYWNKSVCAAPIQEPKPKKLFTTLDGKDILIGDEFWYLENWSARRGVANTLHAGAFPTYSTKEAAKEYIILNKPCLSISELKKFKGSNSRIIEVYVDDLMSIVKSKINHTGGGK